MSTAYSVDAPFVSTSDTSAASARDLSEQRRKTAYALIFNFIRRKALEGATREEIGFALAMSGDTVRPRVVELIADKLIAEDSSRTRKTKCGRDAAILVALQGGVL